MMVLGPVDTRQYPEQVTEGDAWQEARGVGPITERELAELVRWVGATWCAWRLIKPEDQREKFDRKLYERWREGQLPLLRMEELDERQRQRALERLSEWFWKWYEVCGVPSLATQADRQSWIGRLMAARNNPEELAEVMAKLMEIRIARRYELRSALARVRLSISRVISAGELLQVDLVRGARELLNLRAWVARRRAMMVAEAPESGAAQASSPGDTG
jgi:hypothetical protein